MELTQQAYQQAYLGPLLFIIYICDMFIINDTIDFSSYADDTTPHLSGNNFEEVLPQLEVDIKKITDWFSTNNLIANSGKFHLLLSPFDTKEIKVQNFNIEASSQEELLGVLIDSNITFKNHILRLCANANRKLHALTRIAGFMNLQKRRILMKTFIASQFNYCPLVWMIHSRTLNNKINHIHERALRIVYNDYNANFEDLLIKDKSMTVHHRNIQQLAIEMFKVKLGVSPLIMSEIFNFVENQTYNLRSGQHLKRPLIHSTCFGVESVTNLGAKIWNLIPNTLKELDSLSTFKTKIKIWKPDDCPCRICKKYIAGVGFI